MRLRCTLLAAALLALGAAPADAASRLVVRGAGFGHGVGMSQYGAMGYAEHGAGYHDILAHYYTDTQIAKLDGQSEVRVLLQSGRSARFAGASDIAGDRSLDPSTTYRVTTAGAGQVALRSASGRVIATYMAPLRIDGAGGVIQLLGRAGNGVRDGRYRGALEFRPGPQGLMAVNAVDLESYLRGVVPAESPASWPAEALKAQAVAARTYAIATRKPLTGFDQYPDTRSQVYDGVTAERPTSDAAIAATAGEVVTYNGEPVVTYFFSTSGGHTEDVENSFIGSSPQPWLRGVDDPYDDVSPKHRWGPYRWTFRQAKRKLGSLVKGSFRSIQVERRGTSPRVVYADIVGTGGTTRVTGPQLRSRLGLFDTWVYFRSVSTNVTSPAPDTPGSESGGGVSPRAGTSSKAIAALTGHVSPVPKGGWVQVQRRDGDRWTDDFEAQVGAGGRYEARVREAGTYRIVTGADAGPSVAVK
jgi:stage II sporulation protein D